jgi:hypothetical protein
MPDTEALKIPPRVTGLTPPAKPFGNGRARPVRKISSLPEIGTVVTHIPLVNVVVAHVALGLKMISPLGRAAENALDVAVPQLK